MTELQDEICDRLVGQKVGPNWIGGPLHVAALVLDPAFVPATRGDTRPGQFARALGWPVVFCEALIGANSVLPTETERRALAITVFGRVPTGPAAPRAPAAALAVALPLAERAALAAHGAACGPDCPLHAALDSAARAARAGKAWANPFAGGVACRSAPGLEHRPVTRAGPAAHHAAVAVRFLDLVHRDPNNRHALADAVREATKALTKAKGLTAAAEFCVATAGELGLLTPRGA